MKDSLLEAEGEAIDLEALKARFMGNVHLLERVLATFSGQLDADLEELERAILDGDSIAAAQFAHRIKGMSASVEARELSQNASAAEQLARDNCVDELPDYLNRMQRDRSKLAEVIGSARRNVV